MANKTIPELTAATTILGTDVLPIDSGTQTYKVTVADLAETFANLERDRGVPAWNASTTYSAGAIVRDTSSLNGFLYVSLANSNLNHALTNTTWWRKIIKPVAATISTSTTLNSNHIDAIVPVDTTAGAINLTLFTGPAARHTSFTVKDIKGTFGTNALTIVRAGTEKIENVAASFVCNRPYGAYTFYTDGTDWFLVSTTLPVDVATGVFKIPFNTANTSYVEIGGSSPLLLKLRSASSVNVGIQLGSNGADKAGFQTSNGGELSFYTGTVGSGTKIAEISSAGAVSLPLIHNNANGNIISGRYTPTLTTNSNVTSVTSASCHYVRIGSTVTVTGFVTVTSGTTFGGISRFYISLPIASNLTASGDAAGQGVWGVSPANNIGYSSAYILADAATDRAEALFINTVISSAGNFCFSFTYEVK